MKIVTKTTVPAKPLFTLFIILLLSMLGSGNTSAQNVPYAVRTYDATNNYYKLTFYCDNSQGDRSGDIFTDLTAAEWSNDTEKPIHTVRIDAWCMYNGFKPTSCARWFYGVAEIDGLEYLNTSECTSMEEMFLNCTATSLYTDDFDTEKVTTMKDMFKGCTGVESLSVSDFNTSNVTDMSGMFCGCTNLFDVSVDDFNTANVTNMSSMFEGCSNLHPGHIVNLSKNSHFTTGNVTNMSNMFKGCSVNLPYSYSIDFNYFTTDKVTDFSGMFEDCKFIKRLDIHTFRFAAAETMSNIFKNCSKLTTVFVSDKLEQNELDKLNHPDLYIGSKLSTDKLFNPYGEIYVTFDEPTKTLTFHYNTTIPSNGEIRYYPNGSSDWLPINSIVENAVFLDEFENAKPLSCTNWFLGCSSLKQIIGLHKLNVSDVIESASMFEGCESIKVLDLRSFKTDQVEIMTNMFYGCESLNTILISDLWSTDGLGKDDYHPNPDLYRQHNYSRTMFFNCKQLIGYDGKYVDERCVTAINLDYNGKYQFQYAYAGEGGFMTKDNFKVFNDSLPGKWITYEGFSVQGNTITLPAAPPSNVIRHGDEFYGWAILDKEPTTETTATFSDEEVFPYGLLKIEAVYKHPYVKFDVDTKTLTFYYDINYSHEDVEKEKAKLSPQQRTLFDVYYMMGEPGETNPGPEWIYRKDIENVKFDISFNDFTLTPVAIYSTFDLSLPPNYECGCEKWFYGCDKLSTITLENLHLGDHTSMNQMFYECSNLREVFFKIDTKNVTYMSDMFLGCENLTTIDFGDDFSTENVVNMENMFADCQKLKSLYLKDFNTKKVSNFCGMFSNCYALEELDLSSFETSDDSNITQIDITSMFSCLFATSKLERIIVSDKWKTDKLYYRNDVVFDGHLNNLVGGSGKKWNENEVGIANANAETGYLTKLPYTIKYIDAETGEELSDDLSKKLPDEIIGEKSLTIKPLERDGYIFTGWTDGLNGNTGLDDKQPSYATDTITIDPSTDKYNRVYVANWKKLQIVVDLSSTDHLYYPIDTAEFCKNNESGLTLKFIADPDSPQPTHYTLTFNSDEIKDQQGDVLADANGEFAVFVDIPDFALSDDYLGSIVFDNNGVSLPSDAIEFILTTNIPHKDVILYLYRNVIFVSNQSGRYNDASYQWFKDGNPVGEKRQYFTEPVISGSYGARINIAGQKPIYTCALVDNTVKVASSVVKVFPNPALAGKEFTIEIMNYTPGVEYKILVFSNNGAQVRSIATTEATTTLSLPRGIYNIALTANGNKCGAFKIIVEE